MPTLHDTPEGQTHSFNDGCGEPEHNTMTTLEKILNEFEKKFVPKGGSGVQLIDDHLFEYTKDIKSFLIKVYHQARQEAINNCLDAVVEQRKFFANTPLDKRGNGWDWLDKVHSAILSLKDKS